MIISAVICIIRERGQLSSQKRDNFFFIMGDDFFSYGVLSIRKAK